MDNTIQFVETREHVRHLVIPDGYKLKAHGRLAFLQRWLWAGLRRMRALEPATEPTVTFTRHIIDTKDVMQRLYEQRGALLRLGMEPKELLIGSEDFAELMSAPTIQNAMSFIGQYHKGRSIIGLKVRVIPWMRGMVVMPGESHD